MLMPGEELTLRLNGGFTFRTTGNFDFGGADYFAANDKDILTFIVMDIGVTKKLYLKSYQGFKPAAMKTVNSQVTSIDVKGTNQINLLLPAS